MKITILSAIVVCAGLCIGCDNTTETPAAPEAPDPSAATSASAYQPEYAVAIEQSQTEPKQYTVTWSARVNSGGWSMTTDNVLIEEHLGTMAARIYVTLEQPNPSDMVTQAMQTLTGQHDAGATRIERVEFSVRRTTRGVTTDFPAMYSVVKTIKYPN